MDETTLAGLVEAVLADPRDDAVRLIYADALEEAGQPYRAQFIRDQIELDRHVNHRSRITEEIRGLVAMGRLTPTGGVILEATHEHNLREQMGQLCREQRGEICQGWPMTEAPRCWSEGTDMHCGVDRSRLTLRRGMVEQIRTTVEDWLTHGPGLCRTHPVNYCEILNRRPMASYRFPIAYNPSPGQSTHAWYVATPSTQNSPWAIPPEWVSFIPEFTPGAELADYETEGEALEALNEGALLWAQAEAWGTPRPDA